MRRIFFLIFVAFLILGCKDKTLNSSNVEMFNSIGMNGEPECIYFVNPKEGYLFTNKNDTDWSKVTEEQLDDPNYFPKSNDIATIYKTIDGGKNWARLYSLNDYHFYKTSFIDKNAIYIKIIDSKEVLKNKLLKVDLKINNVTVLNFNFERMGEIWATNQSIFVDSKNNGKSSIYSTNFNFTKVDSVKENNVFKDKITLLENKPFVLTWDNNLYDIEKKELTNLKDIIPDCIVKKDAESLIIAGKKKNSIGLLRFDSRTKNTQVIKEFKGYSIVQGLESNDKVICGFIGNIKGSFTEYDLIYSLDQGKTWQIQELKEKSYIRPNCLVNNILYIYSGGSRFQKIVFE